VIRFTATRRPFNPVASKLYLAVNDIEHIKTNARHPQTNGICECFHKTILQEFYQVAFRTKIYAGIADL
jgi:transposase InsO family protein